MDHIFVGNGNTKNFSQLKSSSGDKNKDKTTEILRWRYIVTINIGIYMPKNYPRFYQICRPTYFKEICQNLDRHTQSWTLQGQSVTKPPQDILVGNANLIQGSSMAMSLIRYSQRIVGQNDIIAIVNTVMTKLTEVTGDHWGHWWSHRSLVMTEVTGDDWGHWWWLRSLVITEVTCDHWGHLQSLRSLVMTEVTCDHWGHLWSHWGHWWSLMLYKINITSYYTYMGSAVMICFGWADHIHELASQTIGQPQVTLSYYHIRSLSPFEGWKYLDYISNSRGLCASVSGR